jgi:hypothetical protein
VPITLTGHIAAERTALAGQDAVVSEDPNPEKAFFRALYGTRR